MVDGLSTKIYVRNRGQDEMICNNILLGVSALELTFLACEIYGRMQLI